MSCTPPEHRGAAGEVPLAANRAWHAPRRPSTAPTCLQVACRHVAGLRRVKVCSVRLPPGTAIGAANQRKGDVVDEMEVARFLAGDLQQLAWCRVFAHSAWRTGLGARQGCRNVSSLAQRGGAAGCMRSARRCFRPGPSRCATPAASRLGGVPGGSACRSRRSRPSSLRA